MKIFSKQFMVFFATLLVSNQALGEGDVSTFLESDLRFTVPGKDPIQGELANRVLRMENTAGIRGYFGNDQAGAFFDGKLVFWGFIDEGRLDGLNDRTFMDKYRIESDGLYVEFIDMWQSGLDLRLGRQIVHWGSADQFNPTNPVNALDLEDPIKFGDRVANEMIYLTWNLPWTWETGDGQTGNGAILEEMSLSLVVVPVFRSSTIPESGLLVMNEPRLLAQLVNTPGLVQMAKLNDLFAENGGTVIVDVENVNQPAVSIDNMQYGAHLEWTLLGFNLGLSYYRGYADVPNAWKIDLDVKDKTGKDLIPALNVVLDAEDSDLRDFELVKTLIDTNIVPLDGTTAKTIIQLGYPRMQMFGGQFTGSLDFLGGLGIWAEVAGFVHEGFNLDLDVGNKRVTEVLADTFIKVAAGMDYSIFSWWYLNLQYLHGFVDEYGAENLDDYMVAVNDFKLFDGAVTTRISVILNFQDKSGVLYPNLIMNLFENSAIDLGAFVYFGGFETKFGSPAAGPNSVFLRGRYSF